MSISPARTVAFDVLLEMEKDDAYAPDLLHSPRHADLSPADHGLATEIVMGVLRWRLVLDQEISTRSSQRIEKLDQEVLTALRMGAYQLLFLDRIPAWAALHESVELVKKTGRRSAVGFTNAVLRKLSTQTAAGKASAGAQPATLPTAPPGAKARDAVQLSAAYAHPRWLVERWIEQFGADTGEQICAYDQKIPETVVRLNSADTEADLRQENVGLAFGRLLTSSRRVTGGDITKTHAFREGRVAIQDEASQLVALLVGKGTSILDCCAAPGGKTRILAEQNPKAKVTAVELHPHRARLLKKLVAARNVEVLVRDVRKLSLGARFDRVLADVPCSGTGTLARNPEIKWRLKEEDIADLQARQVAILQSAMKHVAPGGRLIYSTCSLEREENEGVVEKALAPGFRVVDCHRELERLQREGQLVLEDLSSIVSAGYLRIFPGVLPCDGFFAAVLERNS